MKRNRCNLGFSLIELIVSISIITLLTTIFLANYHTINRRTDLTMTAQVLVTDIRTAQSNALGLIQYDGEIPAGGWGVFLSRYDDENDKYIIFADVDGTQDYSGDESATQFGAKTVNLPPKITIDSLRTQNNQEVEKVNIIFLPPDPLTYIITEFGTTTAINIRLKESLNNTTKTVRINFLGLVEVID
ncbi:MAG: prepilin-type N-terminal cleavage/methylation domain-containing protein [Patescibacteria group bacterium]|nr:prepilin-type N-terminal cleavage/methylation domain-containing protein [Patescibacteria group bacterium]